MATYIMLTRMNSGAAQSPVDFDLIEQDLENAIADACPEIEWRANYAVGGPFDYLDIFDAPTPESVMKVAALVRTIGCAHVETWLATPWSDYKSLLRTLPMREEPDGFAAQDDENEREDSAPQQKNNEDANDALAAVIALDPTGADVETALALASGNLPLNANVSAKSHEIYRILAGNALD